MESINVSSEIIEAIDSYVKIMLSKASFVQTDIAKIIGVGTTSGNKINIKGLAEYDNIKSLGDVVYPNDSIVFVLYPNGQPSQAFILGQLFASPSNIKGGSIDIGDGKFTVNNEGKVSALSGSIGEWNIGTNDLYADRLFADGYLRRCYIKNPSVDSDWVFSIQKGVTQGTNPSSLKSLFNVEANGNIHAGNIHAAGNIDAGNITCDTIRINNLQMRGLTNYYMQLNSNGTLSFWANGVYVGHTTV